jgi:hypothetical protein
VKCPDVLYVIPIKWYESSSSRVLESVFIRIVAFTTLEREKRGFKKHIVEHGVTSGLVQFMFNPR